MVGAGELLLEDEHVVATFLLAPTYASWAAGVALPARKMIRMLAIKIQRAAAEPVPPRLSRPPTRTGCPIWAPGTSAGCRGSGRRWRQSGQVGPD
jgi:hypothetical protein